MTKKNSKKLYEHYVKIGYIEAAKNLLDKYPEFKPEPKPEFKPEPKEKPTPKNK